MTDVAMHYPIPEIGWLSRNAGFDGSARDFNVAQADFDRVCRDLPDDDHLAYLLQQAAGGRVNRKLLTPIGIMEYRFLVAVALGYGEFHPGPASAHDEILDLIRHRVGRKGRWLNSFGMIAMRFTYGD